MQHLGALIVRQAGPKDLVIRVQALEHLIGIFLRILPANVGGFLDKSVKGFLDGITVSAKYGIGQRLFVGRQRSWYPECPGCQTRHRATDPRAHTSP